MHGGVASVPGDKLIGLDERRWDTPTVIRIAGCEQATLLQWRRKYGFLGGAEPGRGRVGYRHSVFEICSVCAAVAMIRHGLDPADACSQSEWLVIHFQGLITKEIDSSMLAFHRGGSDPGVRASFYHLGPDQTLAEVIGKTPNGIATILDLRKIINHVLSALGLTVVKEKSNSG